MALALCDHEICVLHWVPFFSNRERGGLVSDVYKVVLHGKLSDLSGDQDPLLLCTDGGKLEFALCSFDLLLNHVEFGVHLELRFLELLQVLDRLAQESLPHLGILGGLSVLHVYDDLILDVIGVATIEVRLKLKFLEQEFEDLLVWTLEVARVVFFLQVPWDLLDRNGVVNVEGLSQLGNRVLKVVSINLILGELQVKANSNHTVV